MYLVIFEDGYVIKREKFSKSEFNIPDWGKAAWVDISNPSNPTVYRDGEWQAIGVE
mgnify:CR=1 FL=1